MFISNKDQLSYIYAQINLALNSSISWMTPQKYIYAYKENSDHNRGYLAVYTVLTDRDISQLNTSLDGSLLDDSSDVYMLVSNEMFMRHILQPTLPDAFGHGATAQNSVYKTTGGTEGKIINNGNLSCGKTKWGLIYYYPEVTSFTIIVDNDQLKSTSNGDFDITGLAGASVTFTVKSTLNCSYNSANQKLTFSTASHSTDYSKHIPWYDWIAGVIGGEIILGIVDLVVELVTNGIADSLSHSVSAAGGISTESVEVVSWTGINDLNVAQAGLSQALYVKGTY
ncbi:MAG: TULIP family P47-like protein [Candidatus Sedimenticola endophacoides]